jgi:choline dehydrogenase-like flavoprotein
MESRLANLLLTGKFRRFSNLDRAVRERVLNCWAKSRLGLLRSGFQTFKRLALFYYYSRLDEQTGTNPSWDLIGYPGPVQPAKETAKTIVPLEITGDTALDAEVVVIGSGAGGGVVAGELAAAGYQVIVLEKGGYANEADFDGAEKRSMDRLYEKKGILATHDLGVIVFAGNTLGGGTTVNWTTSLRTPEYVLRQWENECGIKGAAGAEWQASFDAVCARIGVTTEESSPNPQNRKLIDGCTALGYHWRPLPRNVHGCRDCGYCGYGCRFGAKQGVLKTYLQDAFEHGTRIVTGCHVDRITIQDGVAGGVEGTVNGHRLTIRSKVVVVSGGSVHSPAILKRSGLANKNIGRHLHLHPVAAVFGIYSEPIESWRGTMQAAVCDQFADLDRGYGFVLETAPAHPGMLASGIPWRGSRSHQELMRSAARIASFIAIARDRDGGTVSVDRRGQPVLNYVPSKYDAGHVIRGAQEAARVHAAAGAAVIGGPYNNLPELALAMGGQERGRVSAPSNERGRVSAPSDLEPHLHRFAELGVIKNDTILFSAHQMSSCRMGGNQSQSPVKPDGETYEVKNLFVADASALPTATGVNPMVSIMALAHRTAQIIKTCL